MLVMERLVAEHRARSRRHRLQHRLHARSAASARALAEPSIRRHGAGGEAGRRALALAPHLRAGDARHGGARLHARAHRELCRGLRGRPWSARRASPRSPRILCAARRCREAEIATEIAPCFVAAPDGARTDVIVLACTHYPLLLEFFRRLAPWPVEWIDPAPAIARQADRLLLERFGADRDRRRRSRLGRSSPAAPGRRRRWPPLWRASDFGVAVKGATRRSPARLGARRAAKDVASPPCSKIAGGSPLRRAAWRRGWQGRVRKT